MKRRDERGTGEAKGACKGLDREAGRINMRRRNRNQDEKKTKRRHKRERMKQEAGGSGETGGSLDWEAGKGGGSGGKGGSDEWVV